MTERTDDKDVEDTDGLRIGGHQWVEANDLVKWPHCAVCGIIRRHDDKNNPCKGAAKIALRNYYTEGSSAVPSLAAMTEKLTSIQIGGCTCNTKRPDIEYHDARCHYRLASEIEVLLVGKPDEVCWFVERPAPTGYEWLAVIDGGPMWTTDPQRAIRFACRDYADKAIGTTPRRLPGFEQAFASEHIFVGSSAVSPLATITDEGRSLLETAALALEAATPDDCCGIGDNGTAQWPVKDEIASAIRKYLAASSAVSHTEPKVPSLLPIGEGLKLPPRPHNPKTEWPLATGKADFALRSSTATQSALHHAHQQLQWIAMQESKAKEFEERGEQRIPCFLQLEYVYESAKVYREVGLALSARLPFSDDFLKAVASTGKGNDICKLSMTLEQHDFWTEIYAHYEKNVKPDDRAKE